MIKILKLNETYLKVIADYDTLLSISESSYFRFRPKGFQWSPKYRSGIWDGYIVLFNKKNGLLPQGLFPYLVRFLKENNIKFKVDRKITVKGVDFSHEWIEEFVNDGLQCKFIPRDYQTEAVKRIFKKRKSINLLPTASGKSFIFYIVCNILKYLDDNRKILLIVPSTNLVEQMASDFQEYAQDWCDFSDYVHKLYGGKKKETDKPITVATWQTLQHISNRKWFQQFDSVLVDEVHSVSVNKSGNKKSGNPGNVISQIIGYCVNADIRVGLSGTLHDSTVDLVQLESLFGPIKKIVKTSNLIDKGYLSNFEVRAFILEYDNESRYICKKMSFQNECDWLRGDKRKLNFIKKLANKCNGNTLILFKIRDYGKKIYELLNINNKVFYIDGNTPVEKREKIRQYTENNDNVIIIASYAVYSTGINIKNLNNIVFAESMASSVKVIQSIGRVLRKHKRKTTALLMDVVDDLSYYKRKNYCLKHFYRRMKMYKEDNFNVSVKRIKLK